MDTQNLVAQAEVTIHATVHQVWDALTKPEQIKQYMLGSVVTSTWQQGASITWQGEWQGKAYEDHGKVLQIVPFVSLQYTHYSPLGGKPDVPENYHTVTINLTEHGQDTIVNLIQDNNASEQEKQHSEKNWQMMLEGLKQMLERG